ncbi:MAG TPA: type II secretion system protein [Verrucomicrobiae bacterium]|nr:type II secretion system protein [Verrucomicrobiae bacterium]
MISLKQKSKGFTIVELLIVIVVIAILATLVIVTFTGIQQKARDSKRQTDIDALDSHLEAFYANNGYYPTITDLVTSGAANTTWLNSNMSGFDPTALSDPKGSIITSTAPATGTYVYSYVTQGCTTTQPSSSSNECTSFVLTAELEGGGTFVKQSNT